MHARADYRYVLQVNTILISTLIFLTGLLWKEFVVASFVRVFGRDHNLVPLFLLTGTATIGTVLASVHLWHRSYHCKHGVKKACSEERCGFT